LPGQQKSKKQPADEAGNNNNNSSNKRSKSIEKLFGEMVRPNRRWKMCVQQAAATGQKEGKTSGQRKKQTNHSRTNADVAVAATAAAVAAAADVAVAVSKCRRAPIRRQ